MSSTSLMKHKAAITRRKLIITLILVTILVVTFATGFSSGTNDNTVYTANGERVVMWKELPESGTPEDYDLLTNLRFAAQKIYTSGYFRGETNGTATANVGLGIKYTQNVHNVRVVKGDTIFSEAISSSSLKNVAEQKYHHGDTILFRPSKSVSGDEATYSDEVVKMSLESFLAAYGVKPNELTSFYIQPETILSATDDNVLVKEPANADGSDEDSKDDADNYDYPFEVPSTLVADENDIYRFTLELDKAGSTKYNRNEVRTLASADSNPVFYSVKLTFEIDKYWNPISVTSVQNYDIAIPVLGSMNIWSTLTEEFTDIGKTDGEVPEREFFEAHLDAVEGEIPDGPINPADYLAEAFAPYLDGSQNLDLAANISINGFDINDLKLSVNIGSPLSVKAKLDPLAIEYSGDKVYLTLNELKGYLSTDKFGDLLADPALSGLLGSLGELPDFNNLIGPDILSTVFEDCEMTTTNGVVCIHLPFCLGDSIKVDASIYINDETKELVSISGTVNALGMEIGLDVKPSTSDFPTVDSSYSDLTPLLDFVPDAVNFALNETYGLSGTVDLYDADIVINDLYIDRTDVKDIKDIDRLKVDGNLTIGGVKATLRLTGGIIYLQIGDIRVKAAVADIDKLVGSVTEIIGGKATSGDMLSGMLDKLMPTGSITDILSMLKCFSVSGNTLDANLSALGTTVYLSLTRGNGTLQSLNASVDALSLKANLNLSNPTRRNVTVANESSYITPDDLLAYAAPIKALISEVKGAQAIELGLSVSIALGDTDINVTCDNLTIAFEENGNIAVSGMLYVLDDVAIELVYKSNVLYLRMGNIVSGAIDSEHNVAVSFDTTTDLKTLNNILSEYLPKYLSDELAKMLAPNGNTEDNENNADGESSDGDDIGDDNNSDNGTSAISKLGLIIQKFKTIAEDSSAETIVNSLFGELGTLYKNSAAYYLLDMIGMKKCDGELTLTVNVLGAELAITPTLNADKTKLAGAVASISTSKTSEGGVISVDTIGTLRLDKINTLNDPENPVTISAPDGDFVPLIEYVQLISNALNTFTTATGYDVGDILGDEDEATDKTITFEIPAIDSPIVYQEKATDADGNILTNDDGTAKISNTITISSRNDKDGNPLSLLKGKIFIPADENEQTDVQLEAHVKLSISKLKDTYGDIALDLYVVDKTAYLKYIEGNGHSETVSIDYDSVMEILASVMNIVGLGGDEFKDEEGNTLVDRIFGDYNQAIDATVFESMKIAGFSDIQKMVANIAAAVENIETAFDSLKAAWKVVTSSKTVEELGERLDELSAHFDQAIAALKGIKLGDGEVNIDNDLMKRVLGGIKLGVDNSVDGEKTLYADVNNSLTVGDAPAANGSKYARVSVTQTTNREKNVIKGIRIKDLDVNTSIIDAGITFIAGDPVTITLPDDPKNPKDPNADAKHPVDPTDPANIDYMFASDKTNYKYTYSDLSNIKHLLYDVMNTANLLEFEIGDKTSTKEDYIQVSLNLIKIINVNINIAYSVKVEIIPQDDGKFKTAAIVDLVFKDISMGVIPDCNTRLIFYDDMFYVEGVAWRQERIKKLGTWRYHAYTEPISAVYTLNEFTGMISDDMEKFLYDFLFYLIPLKIDFAAVPVPFDSPWTSIGTNLQKTIVDNVKGDGSSTNKATPTIATVFKGYSYGVDEASDANNTDRQHRATIGLKELTGNSSFGDVKLSITGKNDVSNNTDNTDNTTDSDDNLLDNYISNLYVDANLVEITAVSVTIKLNATLRNVDDKYTDENGVTRIKSIGLTPTVIGNKSYSVSEMTTDYVNTVAWLQGGTFTLPDWLAWA